MRTATAHIKTSRRVSSSAARPSVRSTEASSRNVHIAWASFFLLWTLLLSGVLADTVGNPGALQLFRLNRLLDGQRANQARLESEAERLEIESARLEKSKAAQEHEIRRVLGYTGPDELVFDFTSQAQTVK